MDTHDGALVLAGVIGTAVAVVHGILVQRLLIKPVQSAAAAKMPASGLRLVAGLLQFTTFNWFVGGIVLIAAAFTFGQEARIVSGLLVASSYLYGALANLWATRARHPGWVLYGIAVLLIGYGLSKHIA